MKNEAITIQKESHKVRDELAEKWTLNNTNSNPEYVLAAYQEGWDTALKSDPRVLKLVETLNDIVKDSGPILMASELACEALAAWKANE